MGRESTTLCTDAPGGVKMYRDYMDDFVETQQQDTDLPDGFVWIHKNGLYRLASAFLYGVVMAVSFFYTRLALRMKVVNRKILKECKGTGYFLFGNHTQPIGDAFMPVRHIFPKRVFIVISPSNLGIPGLGKMLPILGGLPIPSSAAGMKEFLRAIKVRIEQKRCVVIYPEAHVWPCCSFVRPYPDTSFRFPIMFHAPSFCVTTTYQKRWRGNKPRITAYLDGPFYPQSDLNRQEAQKKLRDDIFACMQARSKNSTYEYIKYVREPNS